MISKEARLDLLAKLFRGASKAKNIGAQTARSVAGLGPGQKFFSSPYQALKNTGRSLVSPQIPGLDRPIAAGVVRSAQLSRPSTWSRLASSSRAPASGKKTGYMGEGWRKPWQGRRFDKTRQGLAHLIRGTGKGSVLATGAGLGVGLYQGIPSQVADFLAQSANVEQTPEQRREMISKLRGPLARSVLPSDDNSPMTQFHNEAVRGLAVPWAREQLHWGQRYDPYGRAAKTLRWLNPAGALMNVGLLPLLERETKPGELQGIVEKTLAKHYKGLTDPRRAAENLASPYADIYRQAPQEWFDRGTRTQQDINPWDQDVNDRFQAMTPLGHAAGRTPLVTTPSRKMDEAINVPRDLYYKMRQSFGKKHLRPIWNVSNHMAEASQAVQFQGITPTVTGAGDVASKGIQGALRDGESYFKENPRALPATETALYLYLKNKGYNPGRPAQTKQLVILTIDNQLKAVRKEQTQPNLSPQRALALKQQETQLTQFRQQMAARRTEHTGSIPG